MKINPFLVTKNGRKYDYRFGHALPVAELTAELQLKGYAVRRLELSSRHYTGVIEKAGIPYFIKIATSVGMGVVTEIEARWNNLFNQSELAKSNFFSVPKTYDTGYILNDYFFLITNFIDGTLLVEYPKSFDTQLLQKHGNTVIKIARAIENLKFTESLIRPDTTSGTFAERALQKTTDWYNAIPEEVQEKYRLDKLQRFVQRNITGLKATPRHGDFAPWHMMVNTSGTIIVIDGEHAQSESVEHYDIGYLIQRVFSVLKAAKLAKELLKIARRLDVDKEKLQVILSMRAIGGFLDESLSLHPDYEIHAEFIRNIVKIEE